MRTIWQSPKACLTRFAPRGAAIAALLAVGAALGACDATKPGAPGESAKSTATSTGADILKTLADPGASDDARLDSIHSAREQQLHRAIPELRKLLRSNNPELVVAAAAALEGLGAEDADLALIEAAGDLGRARHFEHLRQLLYLLGNIGSPRANTYLETVAQGHELPPIRDTAAQILKDSPSNR